MTKSRLTVSVELTFGESSAHLLLHDLNIDLGHVHLPAEFGRELGLLQELGIHAGRHFCKLMV